jgi:hypothetical protein
MLLLAAEILAKLSSHQLLRQCWKMSGSASSTAAREFLTKRIPRKFSYILQEIPVIL